MSDQKPSNRKRNNRLAIAAIVIFTVGTMVFDKDEPETDLVKTTYHISEVPQAPIVNQWDGSVTEVKNYLRNNLNDWDSYESMEWSNVKPVDASGTSFLVRHKYRAANGFGAKIIQHQLFEVSADGRILGVTDF